MVMGTLCLVQKRSNQWMQYSVDAVKPVDAVDAVHSGIVVYGGGDIVFGAKRIKPVDAVLLWMQSNHGGCSGHCQWCKNVIPVDIVVYGEWGTLCLQYALE